MADDGVHDNFEDHGGQGVYLVHTAVSLEGGGGGSIVTPGPSYHGNPASILPEIPERPRTYLIHRNNFETPVLVVEAIIACDFNNDVLFEENNQSKRISTDIFANNLNAHMKKTVDELEEYFKPYSVLTFIQGQIRLNPATKRNARAFLRWTKYIPRLGKNPAQVQFPIVDATELIQHQ